MKINIGLESFSDSESEYNEKMMSHFVSFKYYEHQNEYVGAIVSNLESRFEQKDLIACMSVLFQRIFLMQNSSVNINVKNLRLWQNTSTSKFQ